MALLWNSIATTKTGLLYKSLEATPIKPRDCTWINYIRCHDDIGLGYDDDLIRENGWDPQQHRRFLLDYYCQNLEWSPAKGRVFMHNPKTGDGRITGSAASLLGLEKAIEQGSEKDISAAIDKIILMHGVILSYGGIPLIYGGDEIATLNDYSYQVDPVKREDSRWLNRPRHDWEAVSLLEDKELPASRVFAMLRHLIALRKSLPVLEDRNNLELHYLSNEHILAFERKGPGANGLLVLCNFDGNEQVVDAGRVVGLGYMKGHKYHDIIRDKEVALSSGLLRINPYQILWLTRV
jgi:amylosucrase